MKIKNILFTLSAIFLSLSTAKAQQCNDNAFINSSDPNTIEYDNIVGLYHSTMLKEANGKLLVFGASTHPIAAQNQLSPTEVIPANGYGYTGNILKFTGGAGNGTNAQFAVLTTNGLYYWGRQGYLVNPTVKPGIDFGLTEPTGTYGQTGTSTYGLPMGVQPSDVKMLFGTYRTLAIVTNSGQAWVMSQNAEMFGDGVIVNTGNNQFIWHRVSTAANTPLNNVVALRGSGYGLMALTSGGDIYTWGTNIYLGNGTPKVATQYFAVQMTKPKTGTIKQIGMSSGSSNGNSHYVLYQDGELYTLGYNSDRQLGDWSTNERRSWVQPRQTSTSSAFIDNVAWISSNEHSGSNNRTGNASLNILTNAGVLWAWGDNSGNMLGASGSGEINPTLMPGGLLATDQIMAVETGGHTSMVIKKCSGKYGYVGHKTAGSMGDGTNADSTVTTYNFSDTATVTLCGAATAPAIVDLKVCPGTTADLTTAETSAAPTGFFIVWYTDNAGQPGTKIANPIAEGPGTYHARFEDGAGVPQCPDLFSTMQVTELAPGDAGYQNCLATASFAIPDINQVQQGETANGNLLFNDNGTGLTVQTVTYTDSNGNTQTAPFGTPVDIYTEDPNNPGVFIKAGSATFDANGNYSFTPEPGFFGTVPVEYTAVDGAGLTSSAPLVINVIPAYNPNGTENNPPVANNDTASTLEGVAVNSTLFGNDSDPDGDPLTVTGSTTTDASGNPITIPADGSAVTVYGTDSTGNTVVAGTIALNSDGTYTYTPATGFTGTVNPITYTVSDGNGGTNTADLLISVLTDNGNTTFANDDANSAPNGEQQTGNVLDNDTDPEGNTQTVSVITINGVNYTVPADGSNLVVNIPNVGEIIINNAGDYTFNPDPDFTGTLNIGVQVCDDATPQACDQSNLFLTSLDNHAFCYEDLVGNDFNWSYPNGTPSPITETMVQPGTNGGFVFDIFELDNSFNMIINGVPLATAEIEFQTSGTSGQNIRFIDGTIWEQGGIPAIWQMTGTPDNPLIRVVIDRFGAITMFGSKSSEGPLVQLELFNGNNFNNITWNQTINNNITVSQNVVGLTEMNGTGYGRNIIDCFCYKPGTFVAGAGLNTNVGVTSLRLNNSDGWPQVRQGAWIALESKTKGFVPNRLTAVQIAAMPATELVQGMMVYNITEDCLQINIDGTASGWKCFNYQTCN